MKKIFISGTSRGIGKSLAEHYCSNNFFVIGCSRSESTIRNSNYTHLKLDLADPVELVKQINKNYQLFNNLDIIINNAAIASMSPSLLASTDHFNTIFQTNFFSPFAIIQNLSRIMIKKKFGRIINFSTVLGANRLQGHMAYGLSKLTLEKMTQELSAELAPFNITLNAIGLSLMDTDMTKNLSTEVKNNFMSKQGIRRNGEIRDITHLCDFLISEKSDFISGQIIYLGGVIKG